MVEQQLTRFGEVLTGLLERKKALEFENLLSEMSAKYINLPFDEIGDTLRKDFARLSESLGVDICSINPDLECKGVEPFVWFLDKELHANSRMLEMYEGRSQHSGAEEDIAYIRNKFSKKGACVLLDND